MLKHRPSPVLVLVAAACTLLGIMLSDLVAKPDRKDVPQQAEIKRKEIFKNIALETEGEVRRIRVNAEVCLRQGMLEQLLTRKRTKEHEAILAADIDAKHLHTALLLTGAEPGKTVQFRPKLVAPSGTRVKIFLEYKTKDGKEVRIPAGQWIRNVKSKKDYAQDWVFAGSYFHQDPLNKAAPPFYAANDGDIISVVNFEGACLDVPFLSTKDNADLDYEAHTERIPAEKTAVVVVLEPVIDRKKK